MMLSEIVKFRRDLLFNGAVQVSWCETDPHMAEKAAEHFVFHGPDYHGVSEEDFVRGEHKLVDTASFTLDLLERVSGKTVDEPFTLAIDGYGTGKSHLSVTLNALLSNPNSKVAQKILSNISISDFKIGSKVDEILKKSSKPYLVVTINGMQDFDLNSEIIRQVLLVLNRQGLDTSILENLRPRFKSAINFVESFFIPLKEDFLKSFGPNVSLLGIVEKLKSQDEETFGKVSDIYEEKMGSPIRAVGQESLNDFVRVTKEKFCGEGKPFVGLLIIFDEFGRYLEFSVQKPHVAGSGALQQLFECIQANSDGAFLLCFIQYELKAYISRVAPELRDDLSRYVTRYESIRKVRLSTNLETLIANLLEKKDKETLDKIIDNSKVLGNVHQSLKRWIPDLKNHAVWMDEQRFKRIICKGCWPLHPLATWVLYKLSSVGKLLQQRSALSLLTEVYETMQDDIFLDNRTIPAAYLCCDALVNEFLTSEKYGQQGAMAHAYENAIEKYQNELSISEKIMLKAILITTKIGVKSESKEECKQILLAFSGLEYTALESAINLLESELGVIEWNDILHQYEIVGDAVPKRTFLAYLATKVDRITSQERASIFNCNFAKWLQLETYNTDFATDEITTKEWNYHINCSDISLLESKIDYSIKSWKDARGIDEDRGQLIYCYVGPESKLSTIKDISYKYINSCMIKNGVQSKTGIPLTVVFLHDEEGIFGQQIAEYWVLKEKFDSEEERKFSHFILDRISTLGQELTNRFVELEKSRHIIFATEKSIQQSRMINMLTDLFDIVYPNRIPFPFDGFNTTRGNAAKDCQLFTKELLLGNLDRDWISAREEKQKNRAYDVLDRSWGAIDEDGSIRIKPSNKEVREVIEFIDTRFEQLKNNTDQKALNLGELVRTLCAPPYGLNIASVGLILALYVGKRKKYLTILKNGQSIRIEIWLQEAMPRYFFELSALDASEIMQVSEESLSEWEILLEDWGREQTLVGKVNYLLKAQKLENRIPVPQDKFYKYELFKNDTTKVIVRLKEHDNRINSVLERIERAKEKEDAGNLSWAASELVNLKQKMEEENDIWTEKQFTEIEPIMFEATKLTLQYFPNWLKTQIISNTVQLEKYHHYMIDTVGKNLKILDLEKEWLQLKDHVEKVEQNIKYFGELKEITSKIENLITTQKVTSTTLISVINDIIIQIERYKNLLDEASQKTSITKDEISSSMQNLAKYEATWLNQIEQYKERMTKVYDISSITSISEFDLLRNEVISLMRIYAGQEQDVEDLKMVLKQIDLIQNDFNRLSNDDLSEEELEVAYTQALTEIEKEFESDTPPLDTELIFEGIMKLINERRRASSNNWVKLNVPSIKDLKQYNSNKLQEVRWRLKNVPKILSTEHRKMVQDVLLYCEKQLDEYEIEGLIVRFKDMNREKRQSFLERLLEIVDDEDFRRKFYNYRN
jgi:hypothetical protein